MVKDAALPIKDFKVSLNGQEVPILGVSLTAPKMDENIDDPDLCEYLVRVEWIKTIPKSAAYWEKGLFAIQHTACRMTSSFTIERLSQYFGLDD